MAGEMSEAQFTSFLKTTLHHLVRHELGFDPLRVHGLAAYRELLAAAREIYSEVNLCVWVKTNAGMGSFYRS